MKKRVLALFLGAILALSLCACGSDSSAAEQSGEDSQQEEQAEESQEPADTTKAETDNYAFEIKGAALAQDYEGNPALVVTCSWTNNSENTTSALVALTSEAFQDGVQLDTAIIADGNVYDSDASWKDIRPGTTQDFQVAYELNSETSEVEFELGEWLSSSDNLATTTFDLTALS